MPVELNPCSPRSVSLSIVPTSNVTLGSGRHISEPYKRLWEYNRHRLPLEQFLVSYLVVVFTQIHILYAVWCYQVRHEGRQSCRAVRLSRHWLSACAVGSLRAPCRPCRCVPSRCYTCQSYSINIAGALISDPVPCRMLLTPSLK